ncbi:MAG TPA: hypothetical protein VGB95_03610 [Chitinophagales bacterium]
MKNFFIFDEPIKRYETNFYNPFIFFFAISYGQSWCPAGAEWTYRMISMGGYDEDISVKYQKDTTVEL